MFDFLDSLDGSLSSLVSLPGQISTLLLIAGGAIVLVFLGLGGAVVYKLATVKNVSVATPMATVGVS